MAKKIAEDESGLNQTSGQFVNGKVVEAGSEPADAPPPTPSEQVYAGSKEDLINLEELRVDQDFPNQSGVEELIVQVRIGKPNRQRFIRIHPDPSYRLRTIAIETKGEDAGADWYLIDPRLRQVLHDHIINVELFTAIYLGSRTPFLIPVKIGGRSNDWIET